VKPAPFDYVAAHSVEEAVETLATDPEETKIIAGGQSLVPMMALRLARPQRLVDLNPVTELDFMTVSPDRLVIGATTRHRTIERCDLNGPLGHLLHTAAPRIGHLPIRTRGTFGGSIAHCDPASEWCLIAALLDAEVTVTGRANGPRTIGAVDFFQSRFTTAMASDEVLLHVSLPILDTRWRTGLVEVARRAGDFGIVTVATAIELTDGAVSDARVAIGGVSDIPFRSRAAEHALIGASWRDSVLRSAAEAAGEEVDPPNDTQGDSTYRRALVQALVPRALAQMDTA
jgi:carbon-monoxide dehydrogenase medium subunit